MKKQNSDKLNNKLNLQRETLVPLNAETLTGVNGGISPAWTLTTLTTTVASHPIITCR